MKVCLIAGNNVDYVFSLVQALNDLGIHIELLGGHVYNRPEYSSLVTFVHVRDSQDAKSPLVSKVIRLLRYYYRCLAHIWKSDAPVVHIQMFRFGLLEGTLLTFLYKALGKKIVYTAHNVQPKGKNNALNRLKYSLIYRNLDHIICHTDEIKDKLVSRYHISPQKVSVVQRGLNQLTPVSSISQAAARQRLGIEPVARVLLIFGRIRPEKGHTIALQALEYLLPSMKPITLLITGQAVRQSHQTYLNQLKRYISEHHLEESVKFYDYHIPEEDIEVFFKASDVALLPYVEGDFQSGVLFLAYRFGVPVIASDIGPLPEAITQGVWGYDFEAGNARALANRICQLYQELHQQPGLRQTIQQHTEMAYSWAQTAAETADIYHSLLRHRAQRVPLTR